jgi:hypothetical protein
MSVNDSRHEVEAEFAKTDVQLGQDLIQEAGAKRPEPDSVKHLLKRLGLHQLVLDRRLRWTNTWLLILSVIMAFGSLASIVEAFYAVFACYRK